MKSAERWNVDLQKQLYCQTDPNMVPMSRALKMMTLARGCRLWHLGDRDQRVAIYLSKAETHLL